MLLFISIYTSYANSLHFFYILLKKPTKFEAEIIKVGNVRCINKTMTA